MSWRVVVRPEADDDVTEAANRYESQQEGLGGEFREGVITVLDSLANNPFLNSRKHPRRPVRWRYPDRYPYRVVYEVIEPEKRLVIVAAVIHAARHDRHWKKRL
jgi:toxin ParE1/3/4